MHRPISSDLRVVDATTMMVRNYIDPEAFEPPDKEWETLSFRSALLPKTELFSAEIQLAHRPDLCRMIIAAVDILLIRTTPSISRMARVRGVVQDLIKLIEYCWIKRLYSPIHLKRAQWDSLVQDIGKGGWTQALLLKDRIEDFATNLKDSKITEIDRLVKPPKTASHRSRGFGTVSVEVAQTLRTNAAQSVLPIAGVVLNAVRAGLPFPVIEAVPLKTSTLKCIFANLNLLRDLHDGIAVDVVPVPALRRRAAAMGRPAARTKSLTPKALGERLLQAYEWIYVIGPGVLSIYSSLMKKVLRSDGRQLVPETITYHLRRLPEVIDFERVHGCSVTTLLNATPDTNTTSLVLLLKKTLTACFSVITTMNARRKSEVIHPTVGLHLGSLVEIDEATNLFECEFYIVKTVRDYVPFFVNNATRDAIRLLNSLAKLTWDWEVARAHVANSDIPRSKKIFVLPIMGIQERKRQKLGPARFKYEIQEISGLGVMGLQSGVEEDFADQTHIGRRSYCLLYLYGWEEGTLVALRQKLVSSSIVSPMHYVTDSSATALEEIGFARWASNREINLRAHHETQEGLACELKAVADEKLQAFVADVVSHKRRFSGGYWRFVEKAHTALLKYIDYSALSSNKKKLKLARTLIGRGHEPVPFLHGNCWAGDSKHLGNCRSRSDGHLERENASPKLCASCVYHDCTKVHLSSLEHEAGVLRTAALTGDQTIQGGRIRRDLENLERVIVLHKRRLGLDE
jgi:hypothetical protein